MIVLPDTESRMIVSSFVWTKHQNVTDGQTDRSAVAITAVYNCEQCGRAEWSPPVPLTALGELTAFPKSVS